MLLIAYGSYKFVLLSNRENYALQMATHENYFQSNATISQSNGFQIAAAITAYKDGNISIEDEEIGKLKFYEKSWGYEGQDQV